MLSLERGGRGRRAEISFERLEILAERYAVDGPRYTSYPTAPAWTAAYSGEQLRKALGRPVRSEADPLSLYVHVPFCRSLCHFCACNRVVTRRSEPPARYLDVIEREICAVREALPGSRRVTQLHWGGGTPTHLDPSQIQRLFRALTDAFPLEPGAEVSIEVDPRVTGEAHVEALRECGFGRISLGVQDFDPAVQQAIHRIQSEEETARLSQQARDAGFRSVSFDLIYGLPFQSEDSFRRTLDSVSAMAPDRVALYGYAHVTWVAKQQRGFERHDLPTPRMRLRLLWMAIDRLLRSGYVYIGMDHFARPEDDLAKALREGTLRRNFMGYTTQAGVEMLGFGPSAISELRDAYAQSHRDLAAWSQAVSHQGLATFRGHALSEEDCLRRFVISRLLCHGELSASDYRSRFGHDFSEHFATEIDALRPMQEDGLLELPDDGDLRVTPLGRLLVRNIAMAFDAYLPEQRRTGGRVFSRTV